MVASRRGDASMVRILIEEGAHVNTKNKVMMLASLYGHTDVVRVLIEKAHAYVNTQNMVRMLSQH